MTRKILIIEPYCTGSHAAWAQGIKKYSSHDVEILSMPGRYWKWRMHGGAVTIAGMYRDLDFRPDLIVASDMLDLTTFLALTRDLTSSIPVMLYFHENQLTYPWSPDDRDITYNRDHHYAFINYASALASDMVCFNSEYNRSGFLNALPGFLKNFPEFNELDTVAMISNKSRVLHLGMDLARFDPFRPGTVPEYGSAPVILWNHRWEYDKNPDEFFDALYILKKRGIDFRVIILGENFGNVPDCFRQAKDVLGSKIIHSGYAESFEKYARLLWKADIIPVTSKQDFFGISIMEAVYCGCTPLLPRRLAYPELFPPDRFGSLYYSDQDDLVEKLEALIQKPAHEASPSLEGEASAYDWNRIIVRYDTLFSSL